MSDKTSKPDPDAVTMTIRHHLTDQQREDVERIKAARRETDAIALEEAKDHLIDLAREHDALLAQVASLKVALSDAIDFGQTAAACTSERGRTTADGASRALEALRTVHLSPPASARGEEGT